MKYQIIIEPEASEDVSEAFVWYETQRSGLGSEFLQSVDDVFQRLRRTPEVHAKTYGNVRQTLVKRFPYVVCYVVEDDRVAVVAVFHGYREPTSWQVRVE